MSCCRAGAHLAAVWWLGLRFPRAAFTEVSKGTDEKGCGELEEGRIVMSVAAGVKRSFPCAPNPLSLGQMKSQVLFSGRWM